MADGGNVELVEVDGLVVKLKLKGACGSCPSSLTTMTMGIKRRLMEKIPVRFCSLSFAFAAAPPVLFLFPAAATLTKTHPLPPKTTKKQQEILEVEQVMEEESQGLELTPANVDEVLGEIRPYLVGTGGGELVLEAVEGPIVKIKITGPAASVMTVRVAVTQKLRERIPRIAAVQLV
jgi:Fe-S cluster biogenesis protein NfuA